MALLDFLIETQHEIQNQIGDGLLYPEMIFSELVMDHMSEIGMTFEPVVCHFNSKISNANLKLSGYAISDDFDQLDLFVSLYEGVHELNSVPDSETQTAVEQCLRFLSLCAQGKIASKLDPSSDIHSLALTLFEIYNSLEQIRIFVLTDRVAKSKSFKSRDIGGKNVRLEVMDIERLHRHISEGKPRDELVIDFTEVSGAPLPCIYVPGDVEDYDYALAAIPGEALRFVYEKYGARLLEANVRSFLSVKRQGVNAGIQNTLRNNPGKFMAFNNGIVLVVDEVRLAQNEDGGTGISWIKGMQVVNGGQTTASLFFAKKKYPEIDLSKVRVPAKIIVMREVDPVIEESLVSDISRYANSQNAVKQSDLSANKPFHVEVERLSLSVFCPDGVGRWFYERAAGSYNTLLARDGFTPAKLKALKDAIPASRKLTKTDLAKYICAWEQMPDVVSLGSQKNFDRFMSSMTPVEGETTLKLPNVSEYKNMIAKAILFKAAQKLIRSQFPAFQANVTAYTVSVISKLIGEKFDLEKVWTKQSLSPELMEMIAIWSKEVNELLHRTASGRMVSEWAKKTECKDIMLSSTYSAPFKGIPEFRI